MRVLVTGVTGFVGGFLAQALLLQGHYVAGFARMTSRFDVPNVKLYRGSLTDQEAVGWAVSDFQPEAVCHLGAITPVAYSFDHPNEVIETNLLGTVNLAEACLKEAPVKRFIFASSMEVYGQQWETIAAGLARAPRSRPYTEEDPTSPSCPYAVAKLACEKYLDYLGKHHGFPWVALRQTNAYGRPRTDSRFVVEALLRQMLTGGDVRAGAPRPIRNFMHIDDLVALYVRLLTMDDFKSLSGAFYTVGPDNAIAIEDLVELLAESVGWNGKVVWNTLPKRPGEIHYLSSTSSRISGLTGWHPRVSLKDGLARTVAEWRKP